MEEVAADAAAARHPVAARDRDLAGVGVKVDANRSAINALGVQPPPGSRRPARGSRRCAASSQAAAGQQHIVELLTTLISGQGEQ